MSAGSTAPTSPTLEDELSFEEELELTNDDELLLDEELELKNDEELLLATPGSPPHPESIRPKLIDARNLT